MRSKHVRGGRGGVFSIIVAFLCVGKKWNYTRINTHKHPPTHSLSPRPLLTPPPHKHTQVCPNGGTCDGSVTLTCDDGFYYADHGEVCESTMYAITIIKKVFPKPPNLAGPRTTSPHQFWFWILNCFVSKYRYMANIKIRGTIHIWKKILHQ